MHWFHPGLYLTLLHPERPKSKYNRVKDKNKSSAIPNFITNFEMLFRRNGKRINIESWTSEQIVFNKTSFLSNIIFFIVYAIKHFKDYTQNWTMQNYCP